jgi:hypothetical protein
VDGDRAGPHRGARPPRLPPVGSARLCVVALPSYFPPDARERGGAAAGQPPGRAPPASRPTPRRFAPSWRVSSHRRERADLQGTPDTIPTTCTNRESEACHGPVSARTLEGPLCEPCHRSGEGPRGGIDSSVQNKSPCGSCLLSVLMTHTVGGSLPHSSACHT